jgi:magnesium transporter
MGHVRSRSETDLGSLFSGESGGVRDNNERGQPFEFRALEMALEMACSQLHHQSEALEQEAFPALDELTSKISTLNLERVRRLKSRLMALTVRVQKMRDEVEQLLDDDDDMAEMYLTEKRQKLEPPPESPLSTYSGVTSRTPRTPFGSAFTRNTLADASEADDGDSPPRLSRRDSRASRYSSSTESDDVDVEELEMLLEAYFVQIDGITNKLNALKNYIDDTEDYINLQLDHHRNQLLQLEIILTIATFVMAMFSVVAGVFGMNIPISIFHEDHAWLFKWILLGSGAGGMAVFAGLISWIKYNNLIN